MDNKCDFALVWILNLKFLGLGEIGNSNFEVAGRMFFKVASDDP